MLNNKLTSNILVSNFRRVLNAVFFLLGDSSLHHLWRRNTERS